MPASLDRRAEGSSLTLARAGNSAAAVAQGARAMRTVILLLSVLPSFAMAEGRGAIHGVFCAAGQVSPCARACERRASGQDDPRTALGACAQKCERVCDPAPPPGQMF